MKELRSYLKGKKVLVFGLGLQGGGVGDALYLHKLGVNIRITDIKSRVELKASIAKLPKDIPLTLGAHLDDDIDWADIIIKNPGVSDANKYITSAIKQGKDVHLSAALFTKYCPIPIIGITGTRGKSTTTQLTYDLLSRVYPNQVLMGGNIPGHSLLQMLNDVKDEKYALLELSSFQLHGFHSLEVSPTISIFTNIYEDHLNRYSSMEEYVNDKKAIYLYQQKDDILIYNSINKMVASLAEDSPGLTLSFKTSSLPSNLTTNLIGDHNLENIAAVYALSKHLLISDDLFIETVKSFNGLPHRMELVAKVRDRKFINDTTSTTPTSTIKAIQSIKSPAIILLGGESKNLDIAKLITEIKNSSIVKGVVILGSLNNTNLNLELDAIKSKVLGRAMSMQAAIDMAYKASEAGDIILLSPGFASFDLFVNEFDRGDQFTQLAKSL